MYRYPMHIGRVLVFSLTIILVGCATPASVRTLSDEQVKAQEGYLQSQKQYFSVIEKYVDSQVAAAEVLIAAATRELNEKYKEQAIAKIDSSDKNKTRTKTAINDLTSNLLAAQQSDQASLASIKNSVAQLKELHRQMLSASATILSAQRKLNEYIQLQKADEQAVNQLITIVGLERENVDKAVATAADILAVIDKNK
jgi:hypothetical protein